MPVIITEAEKGESVRETEKTERPEKNEGV